MNGLNGTSSGATAAADTLLRRSRRNQFHFELRAFHENDESDDVDDDDDDDQEARLSDLDEKQEEEKEEEEEEEDLDEERSAKDESMKNCDVSKTTRASVIFGGEPNQKKGSPNDNHDGVTSFLSGGVWTRSAFVNGRRVSFELRENVTQKPTSDRTSRLKRSIVNTNVEPSHWEDRWRLWMIQLNLSQVSLLYISLFVLLNVIFAVLFFAHTDRCCDDGDLSFGEVFDFAVQTSTTIGYGGYVPVGRYPNFLVVILSYLSVLLNTVLAGLLFLKFLTPVAKFEFSNVITYGNVNGLPCLQIRVGNADGTANILSDVTARLTHVYMIHYLDENGRERRIGQTRALKLLNNRLDELTEVWTLKHIVDENSPLFGLNFDEYPGNEILQFKVTINAVQDITSSSVTAQSSYMLQDVLIGHSFADQISWDPKTRVVTIDYAKMSETVPTPVWYPKPSSVS